MATALERHANLVKAAKELSDARRAHELWRDGDSYFDLEVAKALYADEYDAYTNPFNVEKTVDARWPNVPK